MSRYYVGRYPRVNSRTGVTGYDVSTIVPMRLRLGLVNPDFLIEIDAMAVLMSRHVKVDQRRRNIEAIAPADYDAMAYYDRWIVSLAQSLIQRGVITTAELAKKMQKHGS